MYDYDAYMKSKEWRSLRLNVMQRDGWKCKKCGKQKQKSITLTVHHKRKYEPGRNDRPSDLITLCADCHERHHTRLQWKGRTQTRFIKVKGKLFEFGKARRDMQDIISKIYLR